MKTSFLSVGNPPPNKLCCKMLHGCLVVSSTEKWGRGGLPFTRGESRIYTKEKGW